MSSSIVGSSSAVRAAVHHLGQCPVRPGLDRQGSDDPPAPTGSCRPEPEIAPPRLPLAAWHRPPVLTGEPSRLSGSMRKSTPCFRNATAGGRRRREGERDPCRRRVKTDPVATPRGPLSGVVDKPVGLPVVIAPACTAAIVRSGNWTISGRTGVPFLFVSAPCRAPRTTSPPRGTQGPRRLASRVPRTGRADGNGGQDPSSPWSRCPARRVARWWSRTGSAACCPVPSATT